MGNICIITGSSGLIGSEAVAFFSEKFEKVIGIDNNMRQNFFGKDASTEWNRDELIKKYSNFEHHNIDIRNIDDLKVLFNKYRKEIGLIIHTAAQPSHDWAAKEPFLDFESNTVGTVNLLELSRKYCPETVFIYTFITLFIF